MIRLLDVSATKAPSSRAAASKTSSASINTVIFKCDNPLCIVGIKITGVPPFAFVGQQGIGLPSGTRTLGWKATSSPTGQAFSVTVTGATLDVPIKGVTGSNAGGVRQLTV